MHFLEKLRKNINICVEITVEFFRSERCKEMQRKANLVELKKMLQTAPFLVIVSVDTDENEPFKVRQLDN